MRPAFLVAIMLLLACTFQAAGCASMRSLWAEITGGDLPPPVIMVRKWTAPPAVEERKRAIWLDYEDTDAFDKLLEATLKTSSSVICIRTHTDTPKWTGRLNEWMAAWKAGPQVEQPPSAKGMDPITVIMITTEVIELAKKAAAWWQDEQNRKKRMSLLEPYLLGFDRDQDGQLYLLIWRTTVSRK
jgi:hypothetical protein